MSKAQFWTFFGSCSIFRSWQKFRFIF